MLPELFPSLRVAIDADRSTKGRFVITGSSSPELLGSISESLAGRIGIIELSPLTLSEVFGRADGADLFFNLFTGCAPQDVFENLQPQSSIQELHEYWLRGGYPELWLEQSPHFSEARYPQYFQTFVTRDLRQYFPGIDLILEGRSGIIPIEIKYANRIKKTALKALHTFCEDRQLPLGIIINNDDQVRWYSDKIVGIPLAFTI